MQIKKKRSEFFQVEEQRVEAAKDEERSAGKLTRYVNAVGLGVGGKSLRKSLEKKLLTAAVCRRHLHANESLHSQAQSSVSTFSNFSLNKFSSPFLPVSLQHEVLLIVRNRHAN